MKSLVFLRKNKVLEGFREGQDREKLGFPKEKQGFLSGSFFGSWGANGGLISEMCLGS